MNYTVVNVIRLLMDFQQFACSLPIPGCNESSAIGKPCRGLGLKLRLVPLAQGRQIYDGCILISITYLTTHFHTQYLYN